jgi:hypothetical protein
MTQRSAPVNCWNTAIYDANLGACLLSSARNRLLDLWTGAKRAAARALTIRARNDFSRIERQRW